MAVNKNFVVKNGFEVNTDLIVADASSRKVGVASTNPQYLLDVRGGIGVTDIYSVGITTVLEEFNVGVAGTTFTVIGSGGPGGIGSVGVGTDGPQYLMHISAPVSTGQTALYIRGDMLITGDIRGEDDLFLDEVTVRNINVTGVSTVPQLVVTGLTSSISINAGFSTFREKVFLQKDLDVDGHAEFDNVNVSGIATIQSLDAVTLVISGVAATNITASGNLNIGGISTFSSFVDINDNLQVESIYATGISTFTNYLYSDVQFTTSNLNVTGFSTFTQAMDVNGNIDVDGHAELDNTSVVGVLTVTGNINVTGNSTLGDTTSDTITATGRFASDLTPSSNNTRSLGSSSLQWKDLYVDGHAEFDNVNIAGIVTTNNIKISGSIADSFSNVGTAGSILASSGSGWYWASPVSLASVAAGSDRQIQFNNSGNLGASVNLTFDESPNIFNVVGLSSATQFQSSATSGTAPFVCLSTTLNSNFNADLLDDQEGSFYRNASNINDGTLAIARGGTNSSSTPTSGGISYGDGSSYRFTTAGTTGQVLRSSGAGAPSWISQSSLSVGSATNATNIGLTTETTDTTCFLVFSTESTGNQQPKTNLNLTYNSSTGALTAESLVKSGGTSSQFLKADGSTDSTSYTSTGKAIAMAIVFG